MEKKYLLLICSVFFILLSCKKEAEFTFSKRNIADIINLNKHKNKTTCIVLIDSTDNICKTYLKNYNSEFSSLKNIANFFFIDINLPENKWYQQWLCSKQTPISCIIDPENNLKSVIYGASKYSFHYIEQNLKGNFDHNDFGYKTKISKTKGIDLIGSLNNVLQCKLNSENDIEKTFQSIVYPYNLYLKCIQDLNIGDSLNAINFAKQIMTFDDNEYFLIYAELYNELKYIVNPKFDPNSAPKLIVENKIILPNCNISIPQKFQIDLFNKGRDVLKIKSIDLGCSCIYPKDELTQFEINPDDSLCITLFFIGDNLGKQERKITINSNSVNYLDMITIEANVN